MPHCIKEKMQQSFMTGIAVERERLVRSQCEEKVRMDKLASKGHPLTNETVLIVEEFELVKEAEKPQPCDIHRTCSRGDGS